MNEQQQERIAYSVKEVAEMISLSVAMVRKEIRAGNIKTRKAGARVLILKADLDRYLKGDDSDE
jgi:excisionase family DNA binding protein